MENCIPLETPMNDEFTPNATGLEMSSMLQPNADLEPATHIDMEDDHEVKSARAQLYRAAKNSIELHKMLKFVSELEGWVQAKITIAAENLEAVKNYIEYEMVSQTLAESNAANESMGDVWKGLKKGAKEFWHGSPEERASEHAEVKKRWLTALAQVGITGTQADQMAEKMIAQGFEPNKLDESQKPVKRQKRV